MCVCVLHLQIVIIFIVAAVFSAFNRRPCIALAFPLFTLLLLLLMFYVFFSLLDLMKILRHNENRMRQHKLKTIESLQVYVSVYVFVFVPPLCFTKLISHYVTCRYCYCLYLLLLFQLIWSCNGRLYNRLMYTHTHT